MHGYMLNRYLKSDGEQTAFIGKLICLLQSKGENHDGKTETAVHPFRVITPKEALDDLSRRIKTTRWPSKELIADRSQDVHEHSPSVTENHGLRGVLDCEEGHDRKRDIMLADYQFYSSKEYYYEMKVNHYEMKVNPLAKLQSVLFLFALYCFYLY